MNIAGIYLLNQLFYRIYSFLIHWYWGGFQFFSGKTLRILERLDRSLALKVSLRYWLKPLYQDYSFLGHVLGFIFRTGRILAAILIYSVICLAVFILYAFWAMFPFYIIYKGFYPYA
ncbi:MAG: Uncharacterized protein G01um101419_777 [Parcubacteria group bacterium Gr01-1014_19]|nr:MAG: Uncharacterized protein G01um101419_777 [Parcubacteria group bacterium Gr01-1014_19]